MSPVRPRARISSVAVIERREKKAEEKSVIYLLKGEVKKIEERGVHVICDALHMRLNQKRMN